jgi:hypothetical protein
LLALAPLNRISAVLGKDRPADRGPATSSLEKSGGGSCTAAGNPKDPVAGTFGPDPPPDTSSCDAPQLSGNFPTLSNDVNFQATTFFGKSVSYTIFARAGATEAK